MLSGCLRISEAQPIDFEAKRLLRESGRQQEVSPVFEDIKRVFSVGKMIQ